MRVRAESAMLLQWLAGCADIVTHQDVAEAMHYKVSNASRCMRRLADAGYVTKTWAYKQTAALGRRKVETYKITMAGRKALVAWERGDRYKPMRYRSTSKRYVAGICVE